MALPKPSAPSLTKPGAEREDVRTDQLLLRGSFVNTGAGELRPVAPRFLAAADCNDIGDRLSRVNLVCASGTEQRLNLRNVPADERTLLGRLTVSVRRPDLDTAKEHLDRRAQKDHRVKSRVEATLIRDGPRDVERSSLAARQEFCDEILAPDVSAVCPRPLASRCVVSLDDLLFERLR